MKIYFEFMSEVKKKGLLLQPA